MKNSIVVLLFILACSLKAQDEIRTPSFTGKTEFKIGYSGNLIWNNGLNFGAEYRWKEKVKSKERRNKQKNNTHQFLFNGNLTFTNNFSSKTDAGIFTNYGLTWRRTNTKGKQLSVAFNPLGYYRSFLPETYEVDGDEIKKVFLPGRSYYAPSLSIGIGKLRKGKKLTGRYFNINLMYRTPYNARALPSISFQYGYRFQFKKKK